MASRLRDMILPSSLGSAVSSAGSPVQGRQGITGAGPAEVSGGPGASPLRGKAEGAGGVQPREETIEIRLFPVVPRDRARGGRHKLKHTKFFRRKVGGKSSLQ